MTTATRKIAYSLEEAAEQLSLSVSHLRRAIRANELVAKRIGQKYRIADTDLTAWFNSQPDA